MTYTCTGCGFRYTEVLPATGHVPGEFLQVSPPETDREGLEQRVCTVCGEVLETRAIPALPRVPAARVELSATALALRCGESEALFATVCPQNVTESGVTWISSDDAVAQVQPDGTVCAIAPGTAVITCQSADGETSAACTVTVSYTVWQWIRHYILFGWTQD